MFSDLFNSDITAEMCFLIQERAALLRKWYNLMIENKDDLAKIITAENVSIYPPKCVALKLSLLVLRPSPRSCATATDGCTLDVLAYYW